MTVEPSQPPFRKYSEQGAYHWSATYPPSWRRSSPAAHARYDAVLRRVSRHTDVRTARGVDLGCGDGVMLYKAGLKGGAMVGVDLEVAGLRLAQQALATRGSPARLTCATAATLPFRSGSVDYVTSVEVIEHVPDVPAFLHEIHRVLRPGGCLVLTTPHARKDGTLHDQYHCYEFTRDELHSVLASVFSAVTVETQLPNVLHRLYVAGSGRPALDRMLRGVAKLAASAGLNPFMLTSRSGALGGWHWLLASVRK